MDRGTFRRSKVDTSKSSCWTRLKAEDSLLDPPDELARNGIIEVTTGPSNRHTPNIMPTAAKRNPKRCPHRGWFLWAILSIPKTRRAGRKYVRSLHLLAHLRFGSMGQGWVVWGGRIPPNLRIWDRSPNGDTIHLRTQMLSTETHGDADRTPGRGLSGHPASHDLWSVHGMASLTTPPVASPAVVRLTGLKAFVRMDWLPTCIFPPKKRCHWNV